MSTNVSVGLAEKGERSMVTGDQGISTFEAIKHGDEEGEYWSARELAKVLGYIKWQNFASAIERAKFACANSGHEVEDHFTESSKVMEGGRWGTKTIQDVQRSHYACYLIARNTG